MQLLATCLMVGIAATEVTEDNPVSLWLLADYEVIVDLGGFAIITTEATRQNVFVGERAGIGLLGRNVEVTLSPDRTHMFLRAMNEGELKEAAFFTCDPE